MTLPPVDTTPLAALLRQAQPTLTLNDLEVQVADLMSDVERVTREHVDWDLSQTATQQLVSLVNLFCSRYGYAESVRYALLSLVCEELVVSVHQRTSAEFASRGFFERAPMTSKRLRQRRKAARAATLGKWAEKLEEERRQLLVLQREIAQTRAHLSTLKRRPLYEWPASSQGM